MITQKLYVSFTERTIIVIIIIIIVVFINIITITVGIENPHSVD